MAISKISAGFAPAIFTAIQEQIVKEVDRIFEQEKERIIAQLEDAREEVVAKATLRVAKFMDVQTISDRIVISVDTSAWKKDKS